MKHKRRLTWVFWWGGWWILKQYFPPSTENNCAHQQPHSLFSSSELFVITFVVARLLNNPSIRHPIIILVLWSIFFLFYLMNYSFKISFAHNLIFMNCTKIFLIFWWWHKLIFIFINDVKCASLQCEIQLLDALISSFTVLFRA